MSDSKPHEPSPMPSSAPRAGMVAVVGAANAGKSSIINQLTGEKVCIVSPVAQTTRNQIRAILTEEERQVVFLDTPGLHTGGKKELNKQMNKMARGATEGMDVVMLVVDRSIPPAVEVDGWIRRLVREPEARLLVVLNKADLPDEASDRLKTLWDGICSEKGVPPAVEWREVSAESGQGIDELRCWLFDAMPEGPLLFPEDMLSDFPRKLAIADVIREKYFHRLRQELPHSVAVWVEHLDEQEGKWNIEAHVYVRQHSQKGMVIGKNGRLLKSVRGEAATELHEMYDVRINLTLVVKVMKDWDKNFWILRKLGYA